MARGKQIPTIVPGVGHIYQPTYKDKKTGKVKRSAVWWMAYSTRDGIVRRSTRQRDQQAAYNELLRTAGRKGSGEIADSTPERVSFSKLFSLVIEDYKHRKLASRDDVEERVHKHLEPFFGSMRVIDLRKTDIDRFKREMLSAEYAPATVNRCLSALRRALQLGADEDPPLVIRAIPRWFGKLDEDNVRTGVVSREMYDSVLPHMAPHVRTAFVIGWHLGMRRGEILSLKWEQVDWKAGVIRLARGQTKNRKPRTAPIYGDMRAVLEMAFAGAPECPYVVNDAGRRVHSIKTAWAAAFSRAGLTYDTGRKRKTGESLIKPQALFHDLRRTAATNMDAAGMTRQQIMEIVGWETEEMFRRYHIGSDKAAINAGEKLEQWQRSQQAIRKEQYGKAN